MVPRWYATGIEAGKQFRRVSGHLHLPTLCASLERDSPKPLGPSCTITRTPESHRSATEVPWRSRHPR